jgi:adenine C2-methylase RlmN of 23S rRNA A2503 and tRNA A37
LRQYHSNNFQRATGEIYDAIIPIAQEHNLFDIPMYQMYLDVKKTLDRLYFVNNILSVSTDYRKFEQELVDLMKYHKEKVNLAHYNVKTNEIV